MANISIKIVLGGGFLILIVGQVIGILLGNIFGVNDLTIILGLVLSFVVGLLISKITLDKLGKNAIVNGFLQGITTSALMMLLVAFLGGYSNYLSLLLIILGSTSGGFIASRKI